MSPVRRLLGPAALVAVALAIGVALALGARDGAMVLVAGLLVLGVVAWRLGPLLAQPAAALTAVARAAAGGDETRRPLPTGNGTLDELARALQRLLEAHEERGRALRESLALVATVTDALTEGVIAIDGRGDVVLINDTARQLVRLRDPVPFPADWLPRDRLLREAIAAAQAGVETADVELRVQDRTIALRARPLRAGAPSAGAAGCVLAVDDLTPSKRLEAVRRDFVANVSHELRTPLTIISGVAETLEDEEMPAAARRQFLTMVGHNARRMQRIVDDLLDLSRIESGGWLPNPVELDVRTVAGEVFAPLTADAAAKGVALELALEGGDHVYADPTAVRQILSNLAENALRHTVQGHVTIFTEAEPAADDGRPAGTWLGVRDSGSGIPAEHLSRIFERFYRADPGRSREAGGTGLGLAIVKHLAEAHGGRVRAESTVGSGTEIATFLPAVGAG